LEALSDVINLLTLSQLSFIIMWLVPSTSSLNHHLISVI